MEVIAHSLVPSEIPYVHLGYLSAGNCGQPAYASWDWGGFITVAMLATLLLVPLQARFAKIGLLKCIAGAAGVVAAVGMLTLLVTWYISH